MNIQDLKDGDKFRIKPQKKWRTFKLCLLLNYSEKIPKEHLNKVLVIFDGCKQMIVEPWTEVETSI
jgi:hypothetical protein